MISLKVTSALLKLSLLLLFETSQILPYIEKLFKITAYKVEMYINIFIVTFDKLLLLGMRVKERSIEIVFKHKV